ncbi:hypothetical protein WJS89_10665 [Sphingomicrobium sp. XHP0235]
MATENLITVLKNTEDATDDAGIRMNQMARRILRKRGIFAI